MIDQDKFTLYHGRSQEETEACKEYVKKWWRKETVLRMEIADQICENQFIFNLPWDMEQTTEIVDFGKTIDWSYMPGNDVEFIYQMNRHRYWICLGQAYAMTGREIYAETFVSQMMSWIKENAITEQTREKTWRTIEAGIRGENWIKAMGYMIKSPCITDEVLEAFTEAMLLHGQYLADHKRSFSTKSNWGVIESSGLFAIGKMLEGCTVGSAMQRGREYAQLALERLERQLNTQVMDDGVHWEQSPMYHNEVLRCCLEVLRIAEAYDTEVPSEIINLTKSMAYANRYWQKPDGTQPVGGDSDCTDIRDILAASAYLFHDPLLKSGAFERFDFESVWDYGYEAALAYESLAVKEPTETLIWLKESGNWYLRSGWGARADYLHVRSGGLGGGHGHFDKLHIDLVVSGEDCLIDPGRYTYVDGAERYRLKSAAAHNSVTVDGQEYTHCLDPWGVAGLPMAVNGGCKKKGDYTYIRCGHTGYMERGVLVNRQIVAIGTKAYVICDEFCSAGDHAYSQHFHMAPECSVSVEAGENDRASSVLIEGKAFYAKMTPLSEDVSVKTEMFPISRHYNQLEQAQAVEVCRIPAKRELNREPIETASMNNEPMNNESMNAGSISSVPMESNAMKSASAKTESIITVIFCAEKDGSIEMHNNKSGMEECKAALVPVISQTQGRTLTRQEAEGVLLSCQGKYYLVVVAHVEAGADCEYIGAMNHYGLGRVMVTELSAEELDQNASPGQEQGLTVLGW